MNKPVANWGRLARDIIDCIRLFESDVSREVPQAARREVLRALRLALAEVRLLEAKAQ